MAERARERRHPLGEAPLFQKVFNTLALITVVGLLYLFATPSYRQGEPALAGRPAGDFAFEMNGKPARLSELRGKIVVVNFWATWCPPCIEELPSLKRLHARLQPLGGMVLGVSVDEDEGAYNRFLTEHSVSFPTYRDPSRTIARAYGTEKYPETYIIGRDGKLLRKIVGPQDWDREDLFVYFTDVASKK